MAEQKTIYKTYKYRLYPNKKQEAIFNEWLETCRRLYNYFIQQRMDRWEKIKDLPKEERKYISFFDQLKHLTQIKKENKYLQRVYAHVLQDVASRVNSTYKRFYQARKKGTKLGGLPKFKQRKEYNSFKYNEYQNGKRFRIIGNKIFLGKVGLVKIIIDRPLPDNISIRTCVVKRDCTNWYACITFSFTKVYEEKILNKSKAIGLDMGIKSYGALSNGEKIENPKWINRHEKKLAHEQRLLSRKIKGSSNWKKQCIKLAKIYQKIRFQRKDFIHKQTTLLVKAYDIIALEDLQITNIMRNRYLAKSINEV